MKKLLGMLIMIAALTVMCVSASALGQLTKSSYFAVTAEEKAVLSQGFHFADGFEKLTEPMNCTVDNSNKRLIQKSGMGFKLPLIKRWVQFERTIDVRTSGPLGVFPLGGKWFKSRTANAGKEIISLEVYYITVESASVTNIPMNIKDVKVETTETAIQRNMKQ